MKNKIQDIVDKSNGLIKDEIKEEISKISENNNSDII